MAGDGNAKLAALTRKLRDLAGKQFMETLNKQLGETALTEVKKGFRASRNPYGEAWAPILRDGQILIDTSRLRNSFTYTKTTALAFRIGTNVAYAPYHQYGTKGRSYSYSRTQLVNTRGLFVNKHGQYIRRSGKRGPKQPKGIAGAVALHFEAGKGKLPARMMVPSKARGLGPIWHDAFAKTIQRQINTFKR